MDGIFSLFLLASSLWAQQAQIPPPPEEQNQDLPAINCGLVTNFASHVIGDGCLQAADNVVFGDDNSVSRRDGYAKFNASAISTAKAIRRIYPFTASDGTKYLVAISSDKVYQSGTGGSFAAITGLSGLSPTENTACVQALGKMFCTNQSDSMFYWDGTSTSTISGGPKASLINRFRNRILAADVAGNQSSLYGSGDLDGTDWTTGSRSTAAFILKLGGVNDGDKIKCLMGTYNDAFIIGKESSLWALYGFDNNDFVLRELSREVGCIDNQSVQEKDGALLWLSKRGVEKMQGTSIDWAVSRPILNILETIVVSAGNSRSATDSTQSDFNSGNLTASGAGAPMSTTISPGSVVPSSWSAVDTSSADFSAGSALTITTTNAAGGEITSSGAMVNIGFESCSGNACAIGYGWTSSGSHWAQESHLFGNDCSAIPWARSYAADGACGATFYIKVEVLDGSGNTLYQNIFTDPGEFGGCSERSIDISTQTGTSFKLRATSLNGETLTSAAFGKVNKVVYIVAQGVGCSGSNKSVKIDFPEPFYLASSTFTSRIFDTGFSTPTWGDFDVDMTSSSLLPTVFRVQSSTANDGGGFQSVVDQTPNTNIGAAQRQYVRYTTTFASDSSSRTPVVNSVSLEAATTGYFISQCRNPGSAITSWGLFQCTTANNGGSFTFYVSTGATCNSVTRTTATWNLQTNNSAISIGVASYVAYRTLFDLGSDGDNQPTLQDCTINWNEGGGRPEVASGVLNHRYHLFYTTSTAASPVNINALVLDYYDRWSLWDDIPARSAALYDRKLLIGDGSDTGFVRRLYVGNDDDGAAFLSKIRTKDWDLGNWKTKKTLNTLWLELSPEADVSDDVNITVNAYIDVANKYGLGTVNLAEDSGLLALKVPWASDSQVSGRYTSIELSNSGTQRWKFYRGALKYRPVREE